MSKRDMYGHLIHVSDKNGQGGFGVSVTWERRALGEPKTPVFTLFHESDDFRQALFSVHFNCVEGTPRVCDIFHDRVAEMLTEVNA